MLTSDQMQHCPALGNNNYKQWNDTFNIDAAFNQKSKSKKP